jgi:hypothetical protein
VSKYDVAQAVLGKASLYDQTISTPDRGVIMAWQTALEGLDLQDCLDAVDEHYRYESKRVMPADVRKLVERKRAAMDRPLSSEDVLDELDAVVEWETKHNRQLIGPELAEFRRVRRESRG